MPFKLGSQRGDDWVRHEYGDSFVREQTTGPERLRIAAATGHGNLLVALASQLQQPFDLLFVLHTARLGRDGRFQSHSLSMDQLELFIAEFSNFLENDARHDFWIRSESSEGLLVFERHNLIFAYGPLETFEQVLRARNLMPGDTVIPSPHVHNYNAEYDLEEDRLLNYLEWDRTPLQPDDEQ